MNKKSAVFCKVKLLVRRNYFLTENMWIFLLRAFSENQVWQVEREEFAL